MSYSQACDDDMERRPLLSSSASGARGPVPRTPRSADAADREEGPTSSFSCRHCLTSYVPIEPLLLSYTLSRCIIISMTSFYFFDQASHRYGDPSMDSLKPCKTSDGHPIDKHKAENVESYKVNLDMIANFSDFLTAVIPAMFLGPTIDRIGRRIGFVMPLLGIVARGIVFLIVLGTGASVYYLYIGTVLEGLGGGFATFFMATYSSVADITTPGRQRALRICIAEAIQVIGASIAGVVAGHWRVSSYPNPIIFACALGVVTIIYALWFWPETLLLPGAGQLETHPQQAGRTGERSFEHHGDSMSSNDGGESCLEASGATVHSCESGGSRADSPYPSPCLITPTNPVVFSVSRRGYVPASAITPTSVSGPLRGRSVGDVPALPSSTSTSINNSTARKPSDAADDAGHLAHIISDVKKSWGVYFRPNDSSHPDRRSVLALCFFSFLLTVFVNFSKPSIESTYRMSILCWNAVVDSEFSAAWLVGHWVCILLLLLVLQRCLHVHSVYIAMIGCLSDMAAALVFSLATLPDISSAASSVLVYAAAGSGSLARALIPMLRSMASGAVGKDEQGAMFVSFACVELLGVAVFDIVAGRIYKATVHVWSGIIFIIMVFFMVLVMVLLVRLSFVFRKRNRDRRVTQYESFASS